jgi:aspartyl-tRNA synthetase
MLKYGTDKPDLRNPLEIIDITDIFEGTAFKPFQRKTVRAINVQDCAGQPRSFFENMLKFAEDIGMKGLGYIKVTETGEYQGPINKYLPDDRRTS